MNFGFNSPVFPPAPEPATPPRIWKSLGIIAQDVSGWCECHYAIDSIGGDADPDTEAEMRAQACQLLHVLTRHAGPVDGAAIYSLVIGRKVYRARLPAMRWGETEQGESRGHA